MKKYFVYRIRYNPNLEKTYQKLGKIFGKDIILEENIQMRKK